jgi:UDP-2,3-diacylglucosamine pyrophosphatase LpxH
VAGFKNDRLIFNHLDELFQNSVKIDIKAGSKWVIFSDLHVGNGTAKDDFKANAALFIHVLKHYYLSDKFNLILNGDVEELQRFREKKIVGAWPELYWLFDEFHQKEQFYKTVGNHDMGLLLNQGKDSRYPLHHGLVLRWNEHPVFVFHGHQASDKYLKYNRLLGITLKYLANPLRIKNFSVAHSSRKQYAIEKMVYHFSASRKMVSIIGHTHRPLFESLSKAERLKHKIEQLTREYSMLQDPDSLKRIKKSIVNHKKELLKMYKKDKESFLKRNVYHTAITVPCLFNSGCVIGKRGITALEIENDHIRLIHWFDQNRSKRYLKNYGYEPVPLRDSDYYRMIINEENLAYIFTRINLLS